MVLRDIDDLRGVVEAGIGSRAGEVSKVEEILSEELQRFVAWEREGEIAPTIAALVSKADDVRRSELSCSTRN